MRVKMFEEFNNQISHTCDRCGEEFWGDDGCCDDCKDTDLEDEEDYIVRPEEEKRLPSFEVPMTKSQNIYFL